MQSHLHTCSTGPPAATPTHTAGLVRVLCVDNRGLLAENCSQLCSYLPGVESTWLLVASPAQEACWHWANQGGALAVNNRLSCRQHKATNKPSQEDLPWSAAAAVRCSVSVPQLHAHSPVALLRHAAVRVAIPPPQELLQAPQLLSCQRTGCMQAAWPAWQTLWRCAVRRTSLRVAPPPLLSLTSSRLLSGTATLPNATGVCCCRAAKELLQAMSDQSDALQSWQHWPAANGCLQSTHSSEEALHSCIARQKLHTLCGARAAASP